MKKIIFAILAISVLSLGAIFAIAQKGEMNKGSFDKGRGGKRGFGFGRMAEKLNLTDEQKAQIKQITEAEKTKVEPIFTALKDNRQKLADLSGETFDEAKVQALATEQGNLSAQLIVEKERTKSQIFQILTPEQREQAKQLKEEMKDKFKGKFKNRGGKTTERDSSR
jgi:protein CpxP